MDTKAINLLSEALSMMAGNISFDIDYDKLARATAKIFKEEEKIKADSRVIITQSEANSKYGRHVIANLVKRKILQPYRFGYRDCIDEEGNPIVKTKGVIYYRVSEIEEAIENGNVYNFNKKSKEKWQQNL